MVYMAVGTPTYGDVTMNDNTSFPFFLPQIHFLATHAQLISNWTPSSPRRGLGFHRLVNTRFPSPPTAPLHLHFKRGNKSCAMRSEKGRGVAAVYHSGVVTKQQEHKSGSVNDGRCSHFYSWVLTAQQRCERRVISLRCTDNQIPLWGKKIKNQ